MSAHRVLITSPAAQQRARRAAEWLARQPRAGAVWVIASSAEAAQEVARAAVRPGKATLGWRRVSLAALAASLAEDTLAERGLAPATLLGVEAVWSRVVHGLAGKGALGHFERVADRPGLPRALARTVHELRMARVTPARVPEDLRRAMEAFEQELTAAGLVDRAGLLQVASEALAHATPPPLCLYEPVLHHAAEGAFVSALVARTSQVFATVPAGDGRTRAALERALECAAEALAPDERTSDGVAVLQRHLFSDTAPEQGTIGEHVSLISAPGEGREAVELARRIHQEAARGVPFDRMAVLLRAPGAYRAPIAEALRRAGVPAHFARGTLRPDPSGRSLLALLSCAEQGLSARGFAEYLSIGELPPPEVTGAPPDEDDEAFARADATELGGDGAETADEERAALEGSVEGAAIAPVNEPPRSPRKWEQLLVDAAVIGGKDRWARRLDAHEAVLRRELALTPGDDAYGERLQRDLAQLAALRKFSLPLLADLEALPAQATWGEWLRALRGLATRALRHPERVLSLLAELQPMADVGPVGLGEVRRVLQDRLVALTQAPARRRAGKIFVGSIDDARGLSFDVVFAPGLAERLFPQKLTDDPILPEEARAEVSPELVTRKERAALERLQLHVAVGAANERLALSYPRLDAEQARPRVPSFYGLEVLRAAEGKLPDFTELAARAERAVPARLGWPAPKDEALAIDATERDLATLDRLFRAEGPVPLGAARYLLDANPHLARALRRHARRQLSGWTVADGLLKPSEEAVAALVAHRLGARAFSPTALQNFASCPYRFFLSAIHKLAPREVPEPLEQLDPLQRGSLFHEVAFKMLSALRDAGALPLTEAALPGAFERLDALLDEVAREHEELLAPAIERVWQDAVESVKADLREWLRRMQRSGTEWVPWRFELSFGLPGRDAADPNSTPEPVELENGIRLRGSIDLVERSPSGALRATDYKTGKARADERTVVGGGEKLQPVLYALTLEKLFPGSKVIGGRLFYCTQAGGYADVTIPLDGLARSHAKEVARIIGGALERGWFPAAPAKRACDYCDFVGVCGEGEEARTRRKPAKELAELKRLRELE